MSAIMRTGRSPIIGHRVKAQRGVGQRPLELLDVFPSDVVLTVPQAGHPAHQLLVQMMFEFYYKGLNVTSAHLFYLC